MKDPFDNRLYIDRLKREYQIHKNLVIGFDFDNTVYDYHKTGLNLNKIVTLLRQCSNLGFTMCLYSIMLEEPKDPKSMSEHDKIEYCDDYLGISISYVNTSPIDLGSGKPFFNILLDDRAGLCSAYNILRTTLLELKLIL